MSPLKKSVSRPVKKSSTKTATKKATKKATKTAAKKVAVKKAAAPKLVKPPKSTLYEVRRSRIQGRGAFAIKPIRTGQIVDEYWGQRISHEEADRRYDDNDGRHHTFLFVLDDDVVLDARYGGNDARFINHSCEPNCETEIEDGHIYIKAIKPIAPETELTYDYRFEWQDEYEPEDVRYYACRCGSKKCRGTILRVPVYLRPTIREWLAGNDVRKPRRPRRRGDKKASTSTRRRGDKKASTSTRRRGEKSASHPHVAERHAVRGEKHRRSGTR